ncbi:MAG: hypothetical protein IH589_12090 [Anaerolineales bacterium]|nr:hypothetical protein [Anaerolineales bacterium]
MVLPESLGKLTQLQILDFFGNRLTALPESLGKLTQLRTLHLKKNQLMALPESIGNLARLDWLTIGDNQLTALPVSIGNLAQLHLLDLNNNQLMVLPESLGNLAQLHSLNLFNNKLTTLPVSLGNLAQLHSLELSNNKLTALPVSLGNLAQLHSLGLSNNQLTALSESIGNLTQLDSLNLSNNQLTVLPESLGNLTQLQDLILNDNPLTALPKSLGRFTMLKIRLKEIPANRRKTDGYLAICISEAQMRIVSESLGWFTKLKSLDLSSTKLTKLPEGLDRLEELQSLFLDENQLTDLSPFLAKLEYLKELNLNANPLNPELAEAYKQGLDSVKAYLRAKAEAQITLNEAKLILVGEGEVGKTCLMDALLDNPWQEHDTTHGIKIKPIKLTHPDTQTEITLNGWDFGGQRVYRPTHQLFFSAPAVYLVVWKPREGPQQGFVKEWIKLVKHREPDAKILVVATHGGPQQRQPDIDRQELWDLFGRETVADFFFIDSKPDAHGNRKGIDELKLAIARLAAELPEVGRSVPKSFQDVRETLQARSVPYLPLDEVLAICRAHKMDDEIARLFITISHRLGHLTHYQHDPALRDIVILRPDWLATAISYIFDDEVTRAAHGLVRFSRLNHLWDDPTRGADSRYPATLHPIFLRLMERFDLSYRVADPASDGTGDPRGRPHDPQSLIAQLVPDNRPENFATAWISTPSSGDLQQTQICRIVDDKGNTATAEGLFYQLIVRLHKYSLGRAAYADSVHWQRGLVLDDDYNGRALLEHKDNDVHITVRAPYPERFLAMLTEEVKYLVESFWEGLRCDVMVPCLKKTPCIGLFEVRRLIENKKAGRPEQPCPVCNEWQNIDSLLLNAPAARPVLTGESLANQAVLDELSSLRQILITQNEKAMGRFDNLDASQKELLSKADASYNSLMQIFTDEAKEGPRLFSMRPVDFDFLEKPKQLVSQKFRILLWCEHSQLPLFILNKEGDHRGIYEMDLPYEWVIKAAPYLKALTATLSLILPVASSTTKLMMSDDQYKSIEKQLAFGKDVFDSMLKGSGKLTDWNDKSDAPDLPHGAMQRAEGALLRELHSFLKEKDPGFGGLVRVMNKRQEFLWVHERFAGEY